MFETTDAQILYIVTHQKWPKDVETQSYLLFYLKETTFFFF